MSFEVVGDCFSLSVLFRVLRSQTLMEPLFDPTMTLSSLSEKIRLVIEDTLEVWLLRIVRGLSLCKLYTSRLLSSSPTAKL